MVFGLVVRSRGLGGNLMAGLRSLGGGEIHEYTSLLEDTRRQALDRLVQNATLARRERGPVDALRQLRAVRDDERDRRLRDRRHRGARRIGAAGHDRRPFEWRWRPRGARLIVLASRRDHRPRRAWPLVGRGAAFGTDPASGCSCIGLVLIVGYAPRARALSLRTTAERVGAAIGPGGGEPAGDAARAPVPASDEGFIDPTTRSPDARLARYRDRASAGTSPRTESAPERSSGVLSSPAGPVTVTTRPGVHDPDQESHCRWPPRTRRTRLARRRATPALDGASTEGRPSPT